MEKLKEWFKINFSKVNILDGVLWRNYLSVIGIVSSIVTLISFFGTAQNMEISVIYIATIFIAILALIFIYMWWSANQQKYVRLRINNTEIRIREGNIFELLEKKPKDRRGEISIIGVNDYYDTIVDDRIIAKKTLHGQYIERIADAGKLEQLEQAIETDEMINKEGNYVEATERTRGRKRRYSIGSLVEFEAYVLAAFTKFDENNKAFLTSEEYIEFWMRFWNNIDEIYAGRTINIPLMGAGITRFRNSKLSKQELLEIMLWSLKISGFHNTYADKQINIIIYKTDINDIDFYHIQHNRSFR
ncbi:hypothetical protein D3Z36_15125 [Lachnospiraceae bacterium]|nr:hypothetical protein [Lachnospiraceae bacterium]